MFGFKNQRPDQAMNTLLQRSGSLDASVALPAQRQLAVALTLPLKQGVLNGSIIDGIFETVPMPAGTSFEYPLDFFGVSSSQPIAYTVPSQGSLPEYAVSGDYLMLRTYEVAQTIDWSLKYARDARWDIVGRAMQILEAGFVRKMNNDGWHTILSAAKARNQVIYDSAATAGLFTKRLVEGARITMRRNGGGNSTSLNRGRLTHIYVSPEAGGDVRSWDMTQVSEEIRTRIFTSPSDPALMQIFGVNVVELDELGVDQEYQDYWTDTLGGTLPGSKLELAVGLDLSKSDSFVHPVREEVQIFENVHLHLQRRAGLYAWAEFGFAVLDGRRTLALAI